MLLEVALLPQNTLHGPVSCDSWKPAVDTCRHVQTGIQRSDVLMYGTSNGMSTGIQLDM